MKSRATAEKLLFPYCSYSSHNSNTMIDMGITSISLPERNRTRNHRAGQSPQRREREREERHAHTCRELYKELSRAYRGKTSYA